MPCAFSTSSIASMPCFSVRFCHEAKEVNTMKRNNRMLAMLLCLGVISIMLFSCAYVACAAHHDCIGDGCQICASIEACEQNIKNLVTAVVLAIAVALSYPLFILAVCQGTPVFRSTLVMLKVKLSN